MSCSLVALKKSFLAHFTALTWELFPKNHMWAPDFIICNSFNTPQNISRGFCLAKFWRAKKTRQNTIQSKVAAISTKY